MQGLGLGRRGRTAAPPAPLGRVGLRGAGLRGPSQAFPGLPSTTVWGVLAPDRGLFCPEQNHLCLVHCHTLPPCHPAPDAGMGASTPAMLRGRVRHATILLRGPVSHPRAECSVFHTDGDNVPGNRSEGRSSRSLQSLPPNPPGEAASRWPGSVFVTTGTFLWIPRKSIFLSSKH